MGGEALVILPNRTGLWAQDGWHAHSQQGPAPSIMLGQIVALLAITGSRFLIMAVPCFFPPRDNRRWLRWAMWLESLGQRMVRLRAGACWWCARVAQRIAPAMGLRSKRAARCAFLTGLRNPRARVPPGVTAAAWIAGPGDRRWNRLVRVSKCPFFERKTDD